MSGSPEYDPQTIEGRLNIKQSKSHRSLKSLGHRWRAATQTPDN